MLDQGEADKYRDEETRRSVSPIAIATFDDLLIWVGTAIAIILIILLVIGLCCLDGA